MKRPRIDHRTAYRVPAMAPGRKLPPAWMLWCLMMPDGTLMGQMWWQHNPAMGYRSGCWWVEMGETRTLLTRYHQTPIRGAWAELVTGLPEALRPAGKATHPLDALEELNAAFRQHGGQWRVMWCASIDDIQRVNS